MTAIKDDYYHVGLTDEQVRKSRDEHGVNLLTPPKRPSLWKLYLEKFEDPVVRVLLVAALFSLIISIVENEYAETIGIIVAILLATGIGFFFEYDAGKKFDLLNAVNEETLVKVIRNGHVQEIPRKDVVVGDIVVLETGEEVPADGELLEAISLQVNESNLTGEPVVTKTTVEADFDEEATYASNRILRGTTVVDGHGTMRVEAVGDATEIGKVARQSTEQNTEPTPLNIQLTKLANLIGKIGFSVAGLAFLIFFVKDVVLVYDFSSFHTFRDWLPALQATLQYFMMAVTLIVVAVPEGLPMSVTLSLALNMRRMLSTNNLVRKMHACETMGAITVICTDKTGTLTCDKIVLEKYINADGSDDHSRRILRHAFLNSYFQTGLKNLMDKAILAHVREENLEHLTEGYTKIDEIPFDFSRRRMSVVIEDQQGKRQIITKGAVEEMLNICSHAEFNGQVYELTDKLRSKAKRISDDMNRNGMRVLAIAQKSFISKARDFAVTDEDEMVLIGYLAFLDPPKPSSAEAIRQLREYGIEVKILSGDNDVIVNAIARQIGIDTCHSVTGVELEGKDGEELREIVGQATLFSRLTPLQKSEIIMILQQNGNTVGFLGDGVNDAGALRQSDIGISVDSAVDIAKESADIILLDKDLSVLKEGVLEGRKTFGNITKYIKMTASSNFGNMFSVMFASAFLPFLPMLPIHLLIQNLLYDISQTTIPFDRMDAEFLKQPQKWDASDLSRFMIYIGPISSVFDIATYCLMWYVFACNSPEHQTLFQSGWFVEGLLSQTLIVHMIRTRKIPFFQSRATWPVLGLTFLIMAMGIAIPFTSFGLSIGLEPLPLSYFPWLVLILVSYCVLTQFMKSWYIRRFSKWL